MQYHVPVMLDEVIAHLNVKKDAKYIDCTLGDGGYTIEILKRGGTVLGIDINEESLFRATSRIAQTKHAECFTGVQGNFKDIDTLAHENGFAEVSGIVYDLGYSSTQLENDEIGLSFMQDQPLDMRLDKNLGVTAADLVNTLAEKDLAMMLYQYSDEREASKFAKAIVKARALKKIQTTKDLAQILGSAASPGYEHGRINPATRTFQALRIIVNDEIRNLEISLPRAAHLLLPGGRMEVVTFHSLEDKVVKDLSHSAQLTLETVTKKPLTPSDAEVANNNRSRSAKLRIFERLGK
jgi:16S rRNA (cytosine1402-N4)-methyltransferase